MVIDSHTSVTYKSNIFLFGGFVGGDNPHYSNAVYQFDITDILYKEVPTSGSLPQARTDHTANVIGKNMIVFGGVTSTNVYLNDIFILNLEARVWARFDFKGESPSPRTGHACAVYRDMMFILGGNQEPSKEVTKLYCYNSKDHTWRKFCDKYDEDYDKDAEYVYKRSMIQKSQSPKRSPRKSRFPGSPSRSRSPESPVRTPGSPTKTVQSKLVLSNIQEFPTTETKLETENELETSGQKSPPKITAAALKIERIQKKKAQEKKRLLGEFTEIKVSEKDLVDKDIAKIQGILQSITPENAPKERNRSQELKSKEKLKVMRPGISLFSEKIGSRLEPVRLPHLDELSMVTNNSQVFIFGGDRAGLCSNDLFVLDVEDLLNSETTA